MLLHVLDSRAAFELCADCFTWTTYPFCPAFTTANLLKLLAMRKVELLGRNLQDVQFGESVVSAGDVYHHLLERTVLTSDNAAR